MLKKKHIRILKKNYCIDKIYNFKKTYNNNVILTNNSRNYLIKSITYTFCKKNIISGNLNVCSVTGKYKTVFNCLKVSRHTIRNLCNNDKIANFSKINWSC